MTAESVSPAFQEAWHEGELPHFIRDTLFTQNNDRLEAYNLWGSCQDRDLEYHERALGFRSSEIPDNGRVLIIGSGLTRKFERELAELRPDIMPISVDPLLRFGVKERIREAIRMHSSEDRTALDRMGYGVRFPYQLTSADAYYRPGAIAGAIAVKNSKRQGLPFQDHAFNSVLALHSMPQYARSEEVAFMLREAVRVMKPGAIARFYPFFPEDIPALGDHSFQEGIKSIALEKPKECVEISASDYSPEHTRVVFQR